MYFTSNRNILNIKMAAQEMFLDSIDLNVSFNEFDDELVRSDERECKNSVEVKNADSESEDIRTRVELDEVDSSRKSVIYVGGRCLQTENVLTTKEDGEIVSEGEENDDEQMDCDDGDDFCAKTLKDEKTIESNFSTKGCQTSAENVSETLEERVFNTSEKAANESDMETEHSQDECSRKRKRPRLETGSSQLETKDQKTQKGKTSSKTRGGRKKRKRPSNRQQESRDFRERPVDDELSVGTLFEPLRVTAQDMEGKVAKEIAEKLNESKTVLINRVVTCIGGEKALKLFKETQEVQRHGGMWTQDKRRRRTSGGVFLALLKHRYTTKEQIKWIYALENEIAKKKAQAVRQEIKERNKRKVEDLREKLQERDKNIKMADTETLTN